MALALIQLVHDINFLGPASLLVNPSVLTPLRLQGPFLVLVALELFMESSTPFQDQASLRLILLFQYSSTDVRPGYWTPHVSKP